MEDQDEERQEVMGAIALLLKLSYRMVRFRSNLNGRIFHLVTHGSGLYQLAELENDEPEIWVKDVLYEGMDAMQVMNVIWKEVNDVS